MTEKRFIGSSGGVYDQYKSDRFAWSEWEDIIQIMNNLNEKAIERSKALSKLQKENEQLKKDCTVLIYHNQEYRKENEQLKSTINTLTHDNTKMKKVLNTTKNENEQIKQVIKEAYHNERTHIGRNVLKQLLNNIGETNE